MGGDIYLARGQLGVERYKGQTGALVGLVVPQSALGARSSDIDFGPDGRLYVPSRRGVDRYDPDTGALLGRFIDNGSGGLGGAESIAFGGDGFLYVNSPDTDSILRYHAVTGAFVDVFVTPEQYRLAPFGVVADIVYVVPEPGAAATLVGAVGTLALVRRRGRHRWDNDRAD